MTTTTFEFSIRPYEIPPCCQNAPSTTDQLPDNGDDVTLYLKIDEDHRNPIYAKIISSDPQTRIFQGEINKSNRPSRDHAALKKKFTFKECHIFSFTKANNTSEPS